MIPVEENWRKELHDSIINELMLNREFFWLLSEIFVKHSESPRKFVGFQDYCGGVCQQCSRYPVQSKEYGPLDLRAMKTFTAHHHFDKLYISELWVDIQIWYTFGSNFRFFEHAGLFCALLQQNNIQGCEVALLNRITQNITCSTLHFEFFETYWRQEHTSPAPLRPIPRQILMRMCTAWRPKVIELQFRLCWRAYYHHTWPQNASFEKVYFEEDFQDVPKTSSNSPIYFDLVKIDLRFSINACQDILDNENSKFQYARYRNLIANVRRMFPTNKIAIEFAEKVTGLNYGLLRSLFKTVWKNENERDLTLDCNVYLEIGSENLCDFDLLQSKIYFENRYLECSLSPTSISLTLPCQQTLLTYFRKKPDSHWIGRTLQITEKASNCIINLNLYVDKKCMKNLMRDAPEQVERGYLKHFKF